MYGGGANYIHDMSYVIYTKLGVVVNVCTI